MIPFFEHLSPGERLGEVLFGLIMTLTFTLGAGVMVGTSEGAASSLLYTSLGCNVAWGIIDGALDRGRLARLGDAIARWSDEHSALTVVAEELDDMLVPVTSKRKRLELYRDVVAHVRTGPLPAPRLAREDFLAALAVFLLVFGRHCPRRCPIY